MSLRFEWVVFFSTLAALLLFFAIDAKQDERSQMPEAAKGAMIDDSIVTRGIRSALSGDPELDSLALKVKTRKGRVQLVGRVETEAQIDRVIALTRAVSGVRGITIMVAPTIAGRQLASRKQVASNTNEFRSPDRNVAQRVVNTRLAGFVDDQIQGSHVSEIAFGYDPLLVAGSEITVGR